MPKIGKNSYTKDALEAALEAVKTNKMSKKAVARFYRVPKATIQFRLFNKFTKEEKGPAMVLSKEEERLLVDWLTTCSKKGQPRRADDLKLSVKEIMDRLKLDNPFIGNLPGIGWYTAFLRHHPELSMHTPEGVTWASSCISEANIRRWFSDVRASLVEDGAEDILNEPSRMFNCDETGFSLNPQNGKVIAPKEERNVYEVDKGPAKANITVLYCFSAVGDVVPPLLVYPYVRIPAGISKSVDDAGGDDDWGIGNSDNGWITSEVFYEYVGKVFNNYLAKNNIEKPIILFVDVHKTHLMYQLSVLCNKLRIILIVLYPNATIILQQCDVGVFRP